jgi:hypothetical protein
MSEGTCSCITLQKHCQITFLRTFGSRRPPTSDLCNRCVREFLILARTWFAFDLLPKSGVTAPLLSAAAGVARDRVDTASWGLGSPELARTGERGPMNSMAELRPRESDRGRENDRGNAPGGSR